MSTLKYILMNTLHLTHTPSAAYMLVNLAIIDSDNGFSPNRRQAIIWTNARLLTIETLRTFENIV